MHFGSYLRKLDGEKFFKIELRKNGGKDKVSEGIPGRLPEKSKTSHNAVEKAGILWRHIGLIT